MKFPTIWKRSELEISSPALTVSQPRSVIRGALYSSEQTGAEELDWLTRNLSKSAISGIREIQQRPGHPESLNSGAVGTLVRHGAGKINQSLDSRGRLFPEPRPVQRREQTDRASRCFA